MTTHSKTATDTIYTRHERSADAVVHAVGVTAGIAGALWLMVLAIPRGDLRLLAALGLYAVGLVLMLSLSAAYNLVDAPALRERLRAADHAAIFVMIAGTYSPLALITLRSENGIGLFAFIWLAALCGVALKLLWPRRFERLAIAAYLGLGWAIVGMWKPMVAVMPTAGLELLVAGAVLYTVGVGVHHAGRLPYHNALWHALVLAAAACHYAMILFYVAVPALLAK